MKVAIGASAIIASIVFLVVPNVAADHEWDTQHPFTMSGESLFACAGHELERPINWEADEIVDRWVSHHAALGGACTTRHEGVVRAFKVVPSSDPLQPTAQRPVSAAWSWDCEGTLVPACDDTPTRFCGETYMRPAGPTDLFKIVVLDVPDPACEPDVITMGGPRPVVGRIDIDRRG